ncbi:MAG TPA: hypothetical protein VHH88_10135, partial [Verrucomicrobiae bacterium]|nr:hypothetical protein [Verrucomicrobiae bacterium]
MQRSVGVFLLLAVSASAKIITVNTTNNVSPAPGETNLVQAISLLQDGDSIHFNIPGAGPFYLITPPLTPDNGYPLITNNNITIDGYSQPGSSPNSDPILSSNNAQIEIVIDSRAGGANEEQIPGFVNESGAFFVVGATNFTVRGISFLGSGFGYGAPEDPYRYAIALGLGASGAHVNGCWFGLDPNGHDVYPFRDAIAGFQGDPGVFINDVTFGVDKDALDAATARAQFNIMIGEQIPVIIEGNGLRISGNFFNVFPNGMTDYNATLDQSLEAFIEAGFPCGNFLLGTDSDGNNDSEERNIFGGITVANDRKAIEFYGSGLACTNGVVAGNYFGVAVDGVTRFTNSITILSGFPPTTTFRIGSDLDGVEDEIEANLFSDNYPFDYFFPPDFLHAEPVFSGIAAGSRISFRGNQCIGDNIAPLTWADGNGDYLKKLTNVYSHFVLVTNAIMPTLDGTSSQGILRGTCPLGLDPYTNVVVDLYLADQESWTNGQKLQLEELAYYDPVTAQTE